MAPSEWKTFDIGQALGVKKEAVKEATQPVKKEAEYGIDYSQYEEIEEVQTEVEW